MELKDRGYVLMDTRPRVLANAFRKSRDNWKRKCQEAKGELRSARDRVRDLELSRAKWRDEAELSKTQQQRFEEEIQRLQEQLALSAEALAARPGAFPQSPQPQPQPPTQLAASSTAAAGEKKVARD